MIPFRHHLFIIVLLLYSSAAAENPAAPIAMAAPNPISISGQCQFSVAPAKAVIIGGVRVKALKPLPAKEKLNEQLNQIKVFAGNYGGELVSGETLRAVVDIKNDPEPYMLAQRFEIHLPAAADVDTVLEETLKLGMNMYGKNPQLEASNSTPQLIVFFRIENFGAAVSDGINKCAVAALRSWCESSGEGVEICSLPQLGSKLEIQAYYLNTENRLYESYYPQNLSFSKDSPIPKNGDLGGNLPLDLRGSVTIKFDGARRSNPAAPLPPDLRSYRPSHRE